jgi:histone deacetylase complex subunit SAP30
MARRIDFRRQSQQQLAGVVRKHFNGLGVQENEIIVDFLHKVRGDGVSKTLRPRKGNNLPQLTNK